MHFSHVILALRAMPIFSASFHGKDLELCVSSLCQGHAYLLRIEKTKLKSCESSLHKPCKSFKPVTTLLELCASSLRRNRADLLCVPSVEEKNLTTPLGSCVRFALLVVLLRAPTFHPSRTQWVASQAEDAVVAHQELQLLHSSVPGPSQTLGLCLCRRCLLPSLLHEESV